MPSSKLVAIHLYRVPGVTGAVARFIRKSAGPHDGSYPKTHKISLGHDLDDDQKFRQWGAPEDVLNENLDAARAFWRKYHEGTVDYLFEIG